MAAVDNLRVVVVLVTPPPSHAYTHAHRTLRRSYRPGADDCTRVSQFPNPKRVNSHRFKRQGHTHTHKAYSTLFSRRPPSQAAWGSIEMVGGGNGQVISRILPQLGSSSGVRESSSWVPIGTGSLISNMNQFVSYTQWKEQVGMGANKKGMTHLETRAKSITFPLSIFFLLFYLMNLIESPARRRRRLASFVQKLDLSWMDSVEGEGLELFGSWWQGCAL